MDRSLDQKLAGLRIGLDENPTPKKVGPAVPPKPKKPQPQVPKSYAVNGPSEPSYTTPLQIQNSPERKVPQAVYTQPANQNNIYSNIPGLKVINKDAPIGRAQSKEPASSSAYKKDPITGIAYSGTESPASCIYGAETPLNSSYGKDLPISDTFRNDPSAVTTVYRNDSPATSVYRNDPSITATYRNEPPTSAAYRNDSSAVSAYRNEPPASTAFRNDPSIGSPYRNDPTTINTYVSDSSTGASSYRIEPSAPTTAYGNERPVASTYRNEPSNATSTNPPANVAYNVEPPSYMTQNTNPSVNKQYRKELTPQNNKSNKYVNAEMLMANKYRKAEPQAPVYSNLSTSSSNYSNAPSYANIDDIPPMPALADYSDFPPPPADFPPPPSPVSSSYSELRRATNSNQDYATYAPSSQGSSVYDSIYEPIAPRPPSSRSNYSLYAPYRVHEAEVDALTDLLVHSMDSPTSDAYVYGDCAKCGEKVVGEDNGCTAMDQVFHIECFTCCHCHVQLRGKPFYTLEGKPYCEAGYLLTLEKCCVCLRPILDRILRATGRPYHPQCFCCVVCGKSLDGVPFTVDATNQIHCIEDFHKKFAPRCCVCHQPIMPEPGEEETVRVVALDRSFHITCYKCEDCGLVLSSEAEGRGCYPLDDHVLCKSCNAKRVQALTSHMTTDL